MLHCLADWQRLRKLENVSLALYRDYDTVRSILSCLSCQGVLIMLFGFFVFSTDISPLVYYQRFLSFAPFPLFIFIPLIITGLSVFCHV